MAKLTKLFLTLVLFSIWARTGVAQPQLTCVAPGSADLDKVADCQPPKKSTAVASPASPTFLLKIPGDAKQACKLRLTDITSAQPNSIGLDSPADKAPFCLAFGVVGTNRFIYAGGGMITSGNSRWVLKDGQTVLARLEVANENASAKGYAFLSSFEVKNVQLETKVSPPLITLMLPADERELIPFDFMSSSLSADANADSTKKEATVQLFSFQYGRVTSMAALTTDPATGAKTAPTWLVSAFPRMEVKRLLLPEAPPTIKVKFSNEYNEELEADLKVVRSDYQDSTSADSLRIELALARKIIADEKFATATTRSGAIAATLKAEISAQYQRAQDALPKCANDSCTDLNSAQRATLRLILADVDYRKTLLDLDLSFFGGFLSAKPSTPHQELVKLQHYLGKFTAAYERMEKLTFKNISNEASAIKVESERLYLMGQMKAQELTVDIGDIGAGRWQTERQSAEQDVKSLQNELVRLAQEMEQLSKRQAALDKQAGNMSVALAASALGLPPDAVASAVNGDVKGVIFNYAVAQVGDPSSALSKELSTASGAMAEVNKSLTEVYAAYKDVQAFKKDAELIARAIREPSFEQLLQVGELAYSKLSEPQKAELQRVIEQKAPIAAWLQVAAREAGKVEQSVNELRMTLDDVVRAAGSSNILDNAKTELSERAEKFLRAEFASAQSTGTDALRQFVERSVSLAHHGQYAIGAGDEFRQATSAILTLYPDALDYADASLKSVLAQAFPNITTGTKTEINLRIAQALVGALAKVDGSPSVNVGGMKLDGKTLTINGRQFDLEQLLVQRLSPGNNFKVNLAAINLDGASVTADAIIALARKSDSHEVLRYAGKALGASSAADFLIASLPASDANLWAAAQRRTGSLAQSTKRGLGVMMAGALVAQSVPVAASGPPLPTHGLPTSPVPTQQDMMVKAALNAAFPGVGAALSLLETYAQMSANAKLSEKLSEQAERVMVAYQERSRALIASIPSEAIARKESDRARALSDAAKAQIAQNSAALSVSASTAQDLSLKLRLYRPYFFYLAELMRTTFDGFDRSLALWSGAPDGRGFFAQQIAQDPSKARLALDSEIHLFDWLNRDREATKTDPYSLFVHWQQLVSLAESYCADNGCKPGDNRLGQVYASPKLLLFRDLATQKDRDRFNAWRRSNSGEAFEFTIVLEPTSGIGTQLLNVRNIDWRIVPTARESQSGGTSVTIRHLGQSLIATEVTNRAKDGSGSLQYRWEAMAPMSFSRGSNVDEFDLETIRTRFQTQRSIDSLLPLRAIEGLGLYGSYRIRIDPLLKANGYSTPDFEVQIAYFGIDRENVTSEYGFFRGLNRSKSASCSTAPKRTDAKAPLIAPGGVDLCEERVTWQCAKEGQKAVIHPIATARSVLLGMLPREARNGLAQNKLAKDKRAKDNDACEWSLKTDVVEASEAVKITRLQRASAGCSWRDAASDVRGRAINACKATLSQGVVQ